MRIDRTEILQQYTSLVFSPSRETICYTYPPITMLFFTTTLVSTLLSISVSNFSKFNPAQLAQVAHIKLYEITLQTRVPKMLSPLRVHVMRMCVGVSGADARACRDRRGAASARAGSLLARRSRDRWLVALRPGTSAQTGARWMTVPRTPTHTHGHTHTHTHTHSCKSSLVCINVCIVYRTPRQDG